MNCQDFESVTTELARGALMDAAARAAAESHAQGCDACASALRRERALTNALGTVREAMRGVEAPARVEAALLASLRERRDGANANTNTNAVGDAAAPVIPLNATRPAAGVRRAFYVSAVAASLALALFVAWRAVARKTPPRDSAVASSVDPHAPAAGGARGETGASDQNRTPEQTPQSVDRENKSPEALVAAADKSPKSRPSRSPLKRDARAVADALPVEFVLDGGRVVADRGAAPVASDFVPLVTADAGEPLEGGQMVRVEVPRAALAAFGLPVSGERAGETVKADVLLARDGTARAIRLLR
ncbi:MAG: hypothetical protein LC746_17015 [Acidobacteria bacterium]|nr:hypothetical protein [Acidobacteriota bacterium]